MIDDGEQEMGPDIPTRSREVFETVRDHLAANAVADEDQLAVLGHEVVDEGDLVLGLAGQTEQGFVA